MLKPYLLPGYYVLDVPYVGIKDTGELDLKEETVSVCLILPFDVIVDQIAVFAAP